MLNFDERQENLFAYVVAWIYVAIGFLFFFSRVIVGGSVQGILVSLMWVLSYFACVVLLHIRPASRFPGYLIIFISFVYGFYGVPFGSAEHPKNLWSLLLPVMSIYILGPRRGLILSGVYFLYLLFCITLIVPEAYSRGYLVRYMGVYIIITTAIYSLDLIRRKLAREHRETLSALHKTDIERKEWQVARQIQTSILPEKFQNPFFEIRASMTPSASVGGDYFDIIHARGGLWVALGDVSGHGLLAGMIALMMRTSLRALLLREPNIEPDVALHILNQRLLDDNVLMSKNMFMTFTLLYACDSGSLRYSGRHMDFLVYRETSAQVERHETKGTWLGVGPLDPDEVKQDTGWILLGPRDRAVFYSDGITEAMNANDEEYSTERLIELVEEHGHRPLDDIHDLILKDVRSFMIEQKDDMTLMILSPLAQDTEVEEQE